MRYRFVVFEFKKIKTSRREKQDDLVPVQSVNHINFQKGSTASTLILNTNKVSESLVKNDYFFSVYFTVTLTHVSSSTCVSLMLLVS